MTPCEAVIIMQAAHEGQVDKSGQPYWTHPMRVVEHFDEAPDFVKVAALLHDTLEDTSLTPKALLAMGIDPRSLEILLLVTRRQNELYANFIKRIAASGNAWAIKVKLADIADNLSRPLPPELEGLHRRYRKARAVLLEALGGLKFE
jgi:(p)ppGpp synthase/HD superfamily hydrolase